MNYREQFILVEQEGPRIGCNGCCFIGDDCNLQAELGGEEFLKDFDNQVGSCVTDGGVYKRVPDSGPDTLAYNFPNRHTIRRYYVYEPR